MRRVLLLLPFTHVLVAPAVSAQTASAEAQELFDQGVKLMDDGRLDDACLAFEGSEQRAPAIATLFNAATCRERNGQLATAYGAYVELERQTRDGADEMAHTLHDIAADHSLKLKARLSTFTVKVAPTRQISGLAITRNGVAVDAAAWNRTLPADGGSIVVTARAPGRVEWTTTVELGKESDNKSIEIPELKVATAAPVSTGPSVSTKLVPVAVGIAGLGLVGVGTGFELNARSKYDTYQKVGGNSPLFDSANHQRYAAEAFAVAGLSCVGLGVWLYLRGRHHEESPTRTGIAIAPALGSELAGLQLVGRY